MPIKVVTFLTAVNLVCYLDRYIVAAVLPLLTEEFSLTHQEGGFLISAFVVGYLLLSPIFGYLGDRMARPLLMGISVILWSLATGGSGLATSFTALIATRIAVGIGEAGFASIAPGYFKDRIADPATLNRRLALFFAAIPVGSALGYILGGAIAEAFSWRAVFYAGALPGLVLAGFLFRLKEVRQVNLEQISVREGVALIFRTRSVMLAIAGYVLTNFALVGVSSFVASYGVEMGFELQEINLWFGGVLVVSGALGTYLGGHGASRYSQNQSSPERAFFIFSATAALISAPFFALAFIVSSKLLFLGAVFFGSLFVFGSIAPISSVIVLCCPARYVTLTQGICICFLNLFGALLAPVALGTIADHYSLQLALGLSSVMVFLGSLCWFLGSRR